MKNILFFCCMTFFFLSCSKDKNDPKPDPPETTQEDISGIWELVGFGSKDSVDILDRNSEEYITDRKYLLKLMSDSTYVSRGYASSIDGTYLWDAQTKNFDVTSILLAGVWVIDPVERNRENFYFSAFENLEKYALNVDTLRLYYAINGTPSGNYLLYQKREAWW